ncbi:alpha/beta fold hydrolase [Kitasatospora kifunensis]|uniref:Pimeloyl-ACP methyl ester carboxylesterase n=1 Tax=Kitasatospora kifunensis TaxID=58351 RepID=A0A7W7R3M2_KITKI|nr:alpha/beta hydrolase [Kitasatospora kifunensis]MBB4924729.1 pimeloyl-ACP methyl ester carboxylesterase [Kitasatospora kifunensis]
MTRFAHNGEIRIAFEDLGGQGGDPLLLVMGLGTSRFWWPDGLVGELVRRGFHVVAYDQRDAGESTHLPDRPVGPPIKALLRAKPPAYSAEDLADDAVAVMAEVGWDSAHLFGHSMGGLVAQRIAIRHPHRIRSLTTSSAVPSDARGLRVLRHLHLAPLARFARLHFPQTPQGELALATAIARILAAPGQCLGEDDVREFVAKEAEHGVSSFRDDRAQSRQIGAKWHGGPLASIAAPTLVMHGGQDPMIRLSAARALSAAIPGARLVTLPGSGHFLARDVWATCATEIRSLADQADQSPPAVTAL